MLEKLRRQHDDLLAACQRVDEGAGDLDQLRQALEEHLALEDRVFYPAFEKVARGDRRLMRIVDTFAADCREISAEVAAFFAAPETERQVGSLTRSLRDRITKEERILFPLYEQALAERAEERSGRA